MARASIAELRDYVQDPIADVPDATLRLYLDEAVDSVIDNTGLSETHRRFDVLHRSYTAVLLFNNNLMKNEVMAESVDGVSRNYDTNIAPGMQVSWLDMYNKKRIEILGFKGRIG
ncbi:hypothetical protein MAL08_08915 [Leptospira noguchii]|uniref:hypothetical protein n=1 Tax=Leptospira noguchii TaxID=28182 RepID=UPI001FB74495|nr:hypothetical protein [Leptospira noguchii]UOG39362.1 hypothetical protein MAL08_08915 [Leptospira noguchii]